MGNSHYLMRGIVKRPRKRGIKINISERKERIVSKIVTGSLFDVKKPRVYTHKKGPKLRWKE